MGNARVFCFAVVADEEIPSDVRESILDMLVEYGMVTYRWVGFNQFEHLETYPGPGTKKPEVDDG